MMNPEIGDWLHFYDSDAIIKYGEVIDKGYVFSYWEGQGPERIYWYELRDENGNEYDDVSTESFEMAGNDVDNA